MDEELEKMIEGLRSNIEKPEELKKQWGAIDSRLNDEKTPVPKSWYDWACKEGINDSAPDGNVRDLAVSIIEKAEVPEEEFSKMRKVLYELMQSKKEDNKYVKFRAAFALTNHDVSTEWIKRDDKYKDRVVKKLNEAMGDEDKDVVRIAGRYLKSIESWNSTKLRNSTKRQKVR